MAAENSIEQSFVRWCKRHGIMRRKLMLNPGRGWPDDAVFLPNNRVCWIEFKGDKGTLSPQQEFIHRKMRAAGHDVFVCRSLQEAKDAVAQVSAKGEGLPAKELPPKKRWGSLA
jgi:hypothetical protein